MIGLLDYDIEEIRSNHNPTAKVNFELILHTPEEDHDITYLATIDILKDYGNHRTDKIDVVFLMDQGTFFHKIEPYRDNLEGTLKCLNGATLEDVLYERRYKLIITSQVEDISAGGSTALSESALSIYPLEVQAQLVMREYESYRTLHVSGTFDAADVESVMTALMMDVSNAAKIEGETLDLDYYFITPDNQEPRTIVVESGTKALDLPRYLHEGDYGVYTAGIGTYIQYIGERPTLCVYPLFNINRVDEEKKILEIFASQNSKESTIEETYYLDGDVLKVIATTDTQNFDTGDNTLTDTGSGMIYNNPYKLATRPTVITPINSLYATPESLEGKSTKKKNDGVSKVDYIGNESNLFVYRTHTLRKMMAQFVVLWRGGDPELIYPGMPCRFHFEHNQRGILTKRGEVQGVYTRWDKKANYKYTTILYLAVEKTIDVEGEG